MAVNIPNLYRVSIDYVQGALPLTNVYHAYSEVVDEDDIALTFATRWASAMDNIITNTTDWVQARSQEMVPNALEFQASMTGLTSGSGAVSSDACPAGVAMVIRLLTSQGGRSGRGRTYIGGQPVTMLSSAGVEWNSTHVGIAQTAIDNLINNLTTDDIVLCVFSRVNENYNAVTAGVPQSSFGSQRRRNFA